jgi:hypothetical protein
VDFEKLMDDFQVRRRVARQWTRTKSSCARERHRNEKLIRQVPADRRSSSDIVTSLLGYFGRDAVGANVHLAKSGEHFSMMFSLDLDCDCVPGPIAPLISSTISESSERDRRRPTRFASRTAIDRHRFATTARALILRIAPLSSISSGTNRALREQR